MILVDERNRYLRDLITIMFEVRVEKTIACAHRLFGYNGPCESLHGHNYRIEVAYVGPRAGPASGCWWTSPTSRKRSTPSWTRWITPTSTTCPAFRDLSPSAENIAAHIFHELKRTAFDRATLDHVSVWETPTQVAVYRAS